MMFERVLKAIADLVGSRWRWILMLSVLATGLAGYGVSQLQVLASRTALYPDDLEVNKRFNNYLEEFGTTGSLVVVLDGEVDRQEAFADGLADSLREQTDTVESVFYRTDVSFFLSRAPLYLPEEDLEQAIEGLESVAGDVEGAGPVDGLAALLKRLGSLNLMAVGVDTDPDEMAQELEEVNQHMERLKAMVLGSAPVELSFLEELAAEPLGNRGVDAKGLLRSRDGELMFLFVQPRSASDEYEVLKPFVESVREAVDETKTSFAGPVPTVGLTGLPMNSVEETESIRRDVYVTVLVASLAVLLIIFIGFRSLRRGIVVFIPLVMAGVWNLGLTAVFVGHLTLLTSGFTAILFGLGVDYGIFVSGLIQEGLGRKLSLSEALSEALRRAGRTVLTAGFTTGSAFFVIGTVDFKGFAELGIVAGVGVVLVVISTLFVLPSMAMLIRLPAEKLRESTASVKRRPGLALSSVVLAVLLSIGAAWGASELEMDFDVQNIMPRGSESVAYGKKMSENSDFKAEFVAAPVENLEDSRRVAAALRALPTVARVESVDVMVPENQAKKIEKLEAVKPILRALSFTGTVETPITAGSFSESLDPLIDMVMDAQDQAFGAGHKAIVIQLDKLLTTIEEMQDAAADDPHASDRLATLESRVWERWGDSLQTIGDWLSLEPVSLKTLPSGVLDRFQGKSGRLAVMAFPTESIYDLDFLDRFLGQVYEIAPEATGFPSTHQVFSRMIMDGFRQATLLATLVVFLILLLEFRRPREVLLALLPLTLGGLWMFGMMWLLGMRLNYANIIALPMVIGLAVDYGVYLTHRLREAPVEQRQIAVRRGSLPVVLAALTTAAGVGAICLGQHQGAASLGMVLLIGIGTCLLAALWVLPAMAQLIVKK